MAILEIQTNNYYKINFDSCCVRGRKVFVNFSNYASENERQKEKDRGEKVAEFFVALRQSLQKQYEGLFQKISELQLQPDDVRSSTEDNKIDRERFPELRELQDKMNALEPYENIIVNGLYCYGEDAVAPEIPIDILSELEKLGFDKSWISDPIKITNGAEIYVGEYGDEPITQEFYYSRLKSVMGETQDC